MKNERGRLSEGELLFSVFCFMQGTMLRSGFVISITKNDSWAMAFTGLLLALPLVAIYASLLGRFPGKSLIEIDDIIFGPVLGKTVSVLYLFYFLSLAALNTRDLGNFVAGYMMPETPLVAIILLFLLVCVYVIRKGIENLTRLATLFCIASVSALIINTILVLKEVRLDFLKPFFHLPLTDYVQGTVSVMVVPMGEVLIFTMIAPMLKRGQKAGRPLAFGLIFSSLFLAVAILRDIITLGPLVSIVSLPSFESVRYVSLAGILTRMESIYAVVLIILFLFKVSILLYAFVLGLSQLLGFKSYSPLTLLCAALVFSYSIFVFESVMDNMNWGASTAPFFALTFELLLPAISLLTALIKGKVRAREAKV